MTTGRARFKKRADAQRVVSPCAGAPRSQIPPGLYKAICYRTSTIMSYGGCRTLAVYFRVIEGHFSGVEMVMYCTYPTGRISPSTKLYTQWSFAKGRFPDRNEKFAQKVFRGKMYLVSIRSTKRRFADGNAYPDVFQYSVVDTIRETLTGIPNA